MNIQTDLTRFPTRRHEDWRYFRMKKEELEHLLAKGHLAQSDQDSRGANSEIQQLDSVTKASVEALFRHDAFRFQEDSFSRLVKNYAAPRTLILRGKPEIREIHLTAAAPNEILPGNVRILLNPGTDAELTVVVDAACRESLVTAELRIYLAENAKLKLNIISTAEAGAFTIVRTRSQLAENARMLFSNLQAPAGHVRNEAHFNLSGTGADLKLHQAVIAGKNAVNDTVLKAIHFAPETASDMNTITYAAGESRSALNGLIHVKPGSENVNAYQQAKNYILSPKAYSVGYPQLEIENQNVSCSHGTTMHSFDENQLFYLNARGISPKEAKTMILKGNLDYFFRQMNEPRKKQFLKMAYTVIDELSI